MEEEDDAHEDGEEVDRADLAVDAAHEWGREVKRLGQGDRAVGAGEVGQEHPVAVREVLEDTPERGLVPQLGREVERGVERDPDGGLEEHGQAAQCAGRVDAFFLPELRHLLLLAFLVVLVLLADLLLLGRDRLHLLAEALEADLAPLGDRVEAGADDEHEDDDRERPVADERVGEAEDAHEDVGEPGEGAHLAARAAEVVGDQAVEIERREQWVGRERPFEERARVDTGRGRRCGAGGDGLGRRVDAHDHDRAVGLFLGQVGIEDEAVDGADVLEDLVLAVRARVGGVIDRVDGDAEVAVGEGAPDEAAGRLWRSSCWARAGRWASSPRSRRRRARACRGRCPGP